MNFKNSEPVYDYLNSRYLVTELINEFILMSAFTIADERAQNSVCVTDVRYCSNAES